MDLKKPMWDQTKSVAVDGREEAIFTFSKVSQPTLIKFRRIQHLWFLFLVISPSKALHTSPLHIHACRLHMTGASGVHINIRAPPNKVPPIQHSLLSSFLITLRRRSLRATCHRASLECVERISLIPRSRQWWKNVNGPGLVSPRREYSKRGSFRPRMSSKGWCTGTGQRRDDRAEDKKGKRGSALFVWISTVELSLRSGGRVVRWGLGLKYFAVFYVSHFLIHQY